MTVHQYDIVLDVNVINRTGETLQALCLELATMGDLKLVERPQNHTLPPGASKMIRCGAPCLAAGPQGDDLQGNASKVGCPVRACVHRGTRRLAVSQARLLRCACHCPEGTCGAGASHTHISAF